MTREQDGRGSPFQIAVAAYLAVLTVLLPLKFGGIAAMPEVTSFFAGGWFDYLFIAWPLPVFQIAAGAGLILAVFAFPGHLADWRSPAWRTAAIWSFGMFVLALPGWIHATTRDFAVMELAHIAGFGSYGFAVYLCCAGSAERRKWMLGSLAAGILCLVWSGLEQQFWGFERSRQFVLDQEKAGIEIHADLKARAFDTRVFATFTSCNNLAGFLLLALAPLGVALWRCAGRVEPVKWTRILFLGLGCGGAFAVLMLTKSRAAYFALVLTAGIVALAWPMRRRWKIALIAGLAAGLLAGAWYIHARGRGFESMEARGDYLRSSAILLAGHPLAGCGWGEFFHEHMRLKAVESDEAAHDPHNLVMTAAQAGSGMVLLALAGMFYPLLVFGRRIFGWLRKREGEAPYAEAAMATGLIAFFLHAQMDTDFQVPAIMASLAAVFAVFLPDAPSGTAAPIRKNIAIGLASLLLGVFALAAGGWILKRETTYDRLLTLIQTSRGPEGAAIRPDAIRQALRDTVKFDSASPFPWAAAADYMLGRGLYLEAESMLNEALRRSPRRASYYSRLAMIYARTNRPAEAARAMARARELFPHNDRYRSL